jgi:hypothetical protein
MRAVESPRTHTRPTWPAVALLAFAALSIACSNDNNPSTPTTPNAPNTETLNGVMAPKGTATRTFRALQSGTVTVQLARADPPLTLGLGVGIRAATGADCLFSQTVNTAAAATAQLSVAVDAGTYCAGTYDLGTVGADGVVVTITVTHP